MQADHHNNDRAYYLLLFCGTTVLVELWPPHLLYVKFHDKEFLQGGVVSPTPNHQPGGKDRAH
jgi:hypothetical protein